MGALRAFASTDQATSESPSGEGAAKGVEEPAATSSVPPEPEFADVGPLRPGIPQMYVVQIAPELAPVAKVGGLADVVLGLSRELQLRGNTVEIVLPKYDCMRYDHIWGLHRCYHDLWVPWWGGKVHCSVWYGEVHGRRCYFVEPHSQDNFFNRGKFYGDRDDVLRFAFFCRAAVEFLHKSGKSPEIIHCHDWQTALVPVFLYEIYQHLGMRHPRVCFTIHNFRHQGHTGESMLWATELNRVPYFLHPDRLRDNRNPGAINLTKGGIVYSNFVTTVSPNHAWEAQHDQGNGLEHSLWVHQVKYGGVVNGIDYDVWNPEVDRYIPHRYGVHDLDGKYRNKRALRDRLWIADSVKPIIAYVGRLDDQKGLELIRHAAHWAPANAAQFVLLGSAPDPRVGREFWGLKQHFNDNPDVHLELGFNEELSHLIYAGADMMLVPSRFEPCGLTQLVAMRYGTVPVVRAVGGLADTVFDKDYDWRPLHERNGYVFQHYTHHALEVTLHRAVRCYYEYPQHFRDLMVNGMRADHSWNVPAQHYLNIYDHIRDK
ncbi:MAG: glycogen synthase [Polyangiaceae bacterium]|nr:glycogen synthase [Polyangiaceae bacterium]